MLLFTTFPMNQAVLKAADTLEYHPEWVFSGMGAQDIEITTRILNTASPEQMKHTFGLGNLPLYIADIEDPQRVWFNWYWGGQPGHLLGRHVRHPPPAQRGGELRGAEAHAEDVPAGNVQHAPARWRGEQAAAELHDRAGADAGNAVRRLLPGGAGLRDHVVESGSRR